MKDVQQEPAEHEIAIDEVGISKVKLPIQVEQPDGGYQSTIATIEIGTELMSTQKGVHMSRFIEVLLENLEDGVVTIDVVEEVLGFAIAEQEMDSGKLRIEFPYFVPVVSPASKKRSLLPITVAFEVKDFKRYLEVSMYVTSLCPCSKEISKYGAHNQRGDITVRIEVKETKESEEEGFIWIEEIVDLIQNCGSCEIFPLLKRIDEKVVTEKAYENPMFVEDIVRKIAVELEEWDIEHYMVRVENQESIHDHNAYAVIER